MATFLDGDSVSDANLTGVVISMSYLLPAAMRWSPRYFIRAPVMLGSASQVRHDFYPQSSMIRGVLSPSLAGS